MISNNSNTLLLIHTPFFSGKEAGADPGFCARGVQNFARVSARAKFWFLINYS